MRKLRKTKCPQRRDDFKDSVVLDHEVFRGDLMLIYKIIQCWVHCRCSISKQKKKPNRYVRMAILAGGFFFFQMYAFEWLKKPSQSQDLCSVYVLIRSVLQPKQKITQASWFGNLSVSPGLQGYNGVRVCSTHTLLNSLCALPFTALQCFHGKHCYIWADLPGVFTAMRLVK